MTDTGWVDLALLLVLGAATVAGWRRGGLRLAGSVLGLVAGGLVGLTWVPELTASLAGPGQRWATPVGVLLVAALGAVLGGWVGGLLAAVVARLHLAVLDRAAGALGGLLLAVVAVGVVLTLLPVGVGPGDQWLAVARDSRVGAAVGDVADRVRQLDLVRSTGASLAGGAQR